MWASDWEIATDTNTWSDQLFRIYGHEPQSFAPTYERFLSMIHPEDRERIQAIHQQAYATGEPYEMIERIVRPDGEVRFLSSNGQVVVDEHGHQRRRRQSPDHAHDPSRSSQSSRVDGLVRTRSPGASGPSPVPTRSVMIARAESSVRRT